MRQVDTIILRSQYTGMPDSFWLLDIEKIKPCISLLNQQRGINSQHAPAWCKDNSRIARTAIANAIKSGPAGYKNRLKLTTGKMYHQALTWLRGWSVLELKKLTPILAVASTAYSSNIASRIWGLIRNFENTNCLALDEQMRKCSLRDGRIVVFDLARL